MKKTLLTMAFAALTMAAGAQNLYLSTYSGTDVTKLDGQVKNVKLTRTVFKGWNTISLPFAMSEAQLNEYFGSDCKLEKFAGVETTATATTMLFADAKSEGIKPNTPYILYYTGESKSIPMLINDATIESADEPISFTDANGMTITMDGTQKSIKSYGLYGILVKDNDEASFTSVDNLDTQFYATHCYVSVENFDNAKQTNLTLATRHIAAQGDATAVKSVSAAETTSDAVYNISGQRVSESQKGIQIKNHKKYAK